MNKKLRIRILKRLAQTEVPSNLSSEETKTVSGSPPSFNATDYFPIIKTFSSRNATIINGLTNILNQALFYSSNGKIDLPWMRSVNFNFNTSDVQSVDLKNLMDFSKQVYNQLYTDNGRIDDKPLSVQDIADRIAPLKSSQFLNSLSSTNVNGQLASKIGGNVKNFINNYLLQIK